MTQLMFTPTPAITHAIRTLQQQPDKSTTDRLTSLSHQSTYTLDDIQYISQQMMLHQHNNTDTKQPPSSYLHQLLHTTTIAPLPTPPPKPVNKQFRQYLDKQRVIQERRQYDQLLTSNKHNNKHSIGSMNIGQSYAQLSTELSIGINVILMMATGFILCMYVGRQMFPGDTVLHVISGLFGLVMALLVEICLFIIRDRAMDNMDKREQAKKAAEIGLTQPT